MAGSRWLPSSDKVPPQIPPPIPEQFQNQPIEDTNSPSATVCGIPKRIFWFLLIICILFVLVIGLAAGLGTALGKRSNSSASQTTTIVITGSSSTQPTQPTTAGTSAEPTPTVPWSIPNGVALLNYTQVSTEGANCAPTGWVVESQRREDYIRVVTKGTTYYAESTFGGIGFLSSELIYIPQTDTDSSSYVCMFTFSPGTTGRNCNSSTSLKGEFTQNWDATGLITVTLTSDCIGQDGVRILAGEYCKIYFEGDLTPALAT